MSEKDRYDHFLIREGTILVRIPRNGPETGPGIGYEFFDVRTGVQLKEIHPELQDAELHRGYPILEDHAAAIRKSGTSVLAGPSVDLSKVVSILEAKQRKLDSVVADSILDQLQVIRDVLDGFLTVSRTAGEEERFWLSQQLLSILRKFSGRELAELEEIVDWFRRRPKK